MSITTYINDAISELRHVRWPTRQQAVRLSVIVLIFTAAVSVVFGFIDYGLSLVVKFLLSLTY
ncbi:preprotein translocase subunit SecE [Candidatus Peregrinibacteria bacterium CG10_big_fil_rev_8_21_14_0_10_42_8]|nr:MAG: preprotein translocase subunit SecE [Candidatus Peregrinibacteria bacterium CG10_big_fil_rev_8_21_14_0_10_42_8]